MKGSVLMGGMLGIAALAGAGVWYTAEYAYYQEVTGITEITAYGDAFPVSNYRGIDAETSPLKLRACFTVDWDYIPTDEFRDVAEPLNAPRWFDCFDAGKIGADLKAGNATAILSNENDIYGFSTYIAQYPDGNAYLWRQINDCGSAAFAGEDRPAGCPTPPGAEPELSDPAALRDLNSPVHRFQAVPLSGGEKEDLEITGEATVAYSVDGSLYFACFKTPLSFGFLTETYQLVEDARVRSPLGDVPCFDAGQISQDLELGVALAVDGGREIIAGYDRVIAVYPDGNAFLWHQKVLN